MGEAPKPALLSTSLTRGAATVAAFNEKSLWVVLALYGFANLLPIYPGPLSIGEVMAVHIVLALLFALLHGAVAYRFSGILTFAALCIVVGGIAEQIGVHTPFPFGRHHFTALMGPRFFGVPILLVPAYIGMGYVSWMLARLVIGRPETACRKNLLMLPLVASCVMVAWDLAIDPMFSVLAPAWKRPEGGAYFGVPVSNFFGWFVTVYCIYQSFAIYLWRRAGTSWTPREICCMPVLFYSLAAAGIIVRALLGTGLQTVVRDGRGFEWRIGDINASIAAITVFTMGSFALIAWSRLPDTAGF